MKPGPHTILTLWQNRHRIVARLQADDNWQEHEGHSEPYTGQVAAQ